MSVNNFSRKTARTLGAIVLAGTVSCSSQTVSTQTYEPDQSINERPEIELRCRYDEKSGVWGIDFYIKNRD